MTEHQNGPLRERLAKALGSATGRVKELRAFVGLDGFVDEILHVVDKRHSATRFDRVPTIAAYAARLAAAAGQSTNVELVNVMTKLGGNGPIMANALSSFGLRVSYLGSLGYPNLHPVFEDFARRAEVNSICGAGLTDALEFEDGKIMVGKHETLKQVNWANIQERFGRDRFAERFGGSELVAFVNWTMLPHMSEVWASIQSELCPGLKGPRRVMFVDLADPEKRLPDDLREAMRLIGGFQKHFDVILGLNEKEAHEVGAVLGLKRKANTVAGLAELSREIFSRIDVGTLVVHPVAYALAVSRETVDVVHGPLCTKPKITTGAGDHFNSGFCLGKLLGFDNAASLMCGVSTSGYYVRTAKSPSVEDLCGFVQKWPEA